ncbi:phosphoenolpyruvate carboxylase [Mycobacterium sherrisii]|uniref:Phosphoenolpyruvate carboxylase n=2 Tax=Mycobacterium sherrisii TaxID=243061 RepID=A0A1E3TBL2_9MYCO|nr:phosphoenolpyruvate carboxylase [Mycobacterium sherrisii]ODR11058.1 phosphoenolpyruvate carboxylase [Mycobacterium sherrisii]ORW86316.1 phosphoenolpyruvate carboxylase [Mycobacterium sherrisii]
MKHRQCRQSTAQHEPGATRLPGLLHRMRDAAAVSLRWVQRRAAAPSRTTPAIEDQLRALRPICSAQRMSTGTACGEPAVAVAEIHAIDGCDQVGLNPDGDLVETLCRGCLATVRWAVASYVADKRDGALECGTHPMCATCGRPTGYLRGVFSVRPLGQEGMPL